MFVLYSIEYVNTDMIEIDYNTKYIIFDTDFARVQDVMYGYMIIGHLEKDRLGGGKYRYVNFNGDFSRPCFKNLVVTSEDNYVVIEPNSLKRETHFDALDIYIKKFDIEGETKYYLIIGDWCFDIIQTTNGGGYIKNTILNNPVAVHLIFGGCAFAWYNSALAVDRNSDVLIRLDSIVFDSDKNVVDFTFMTIAHKNRRRLFIMTAKEFTLDLTTGVLSHIDNGMSNEIKGLNMDILVKKIVFGR